MASLVVALVVAHAVTLVVARVVTLVIAHSACTYRRLGLEVYVRHVNVKLCAQLTV